MEAAIAAIYSSVCPKLILHFLVDSEEFDISLGTLVVRFLPDRHAFIMKGSHCLAVVIY